MIITIQFSCFTHYDIVKFPISSVDIPLIEIPLFIDIYNQLRNQTIFSMPSTRKQKAKERRSRQLDIMFDAKNVDIMLGSYSGNVEGNDQSENEMHLDSESSRPQRNSNITGEDFSSLLTNSRENSEITIETTRLINEEITNQMSRKLNEIKMSLNSQIQNANSTAIVNTVLPSIQNTLEMQGRPNYTIADPGSCGPHHGHRSAEVIDKDHESSGRQRNPGVGYSLNSWESRPRTRFTRENSRQRSRESSIDSNCSEQNHDIRRFRKF